jgi:hypothetical protein
LAHHVVGMVNEGDLLRPFGREHQLRRLCGIVGFRTTN